ncbi:hypothetical protein N0V93_008336 [Gnomoniopsis smithogilvyi]|uniref:Amino acid transporter n=1 Tax=Gnomoniopsis smithogilvyi TaxID=1191159 RepID=A0A9W9CTT0_9PEZI|nr:hypothetical protein N0V93_008336 [Gnomoniopsis smithogilvyi]
MATDVTGKSEMVFSEGPLENQLDSEKSSDGSRGNASDRADMYRMGKVQELRRDFSSITIFGFTMLLIASWEAVLACSILGLINGGTGGLIWMYLICWISFIFVYLSMAEMASMAPTSGGQYHWVSEFAPRQHQKILSYFLGWLSVLGWQANTAGAAYITGTQLQGLIALNKADYVYMAWHGTLLTIAAATFTLLFNIFLVRKLPLIEGILVVIHIFGFFGVMVTLWVLSPTGDPKTVFTTFSDGGGWGSLGGSALVGISSGILPLLGADAAVHMSEEVKDAGRALPRSILSAVVINGAAGWIMAITLSFCISAMDFEEVLSSPTGYPFMQVFYNATGTAGGATALTIFPIIFGFAGILTLMATSSRQLYAFARDNALPFSPWLAKVSSNQIPLNAILVTFTITCLLSLINLGSAVALNSLTSLSLCALLSAYITCIGCMLWRRLSSAPLLPSKFSLGRYGLAINIIAEIVLVIFLVLSFFPETKSPDAVGMNWSILIYGAVAVFSLVYYLVNGRHRYAGPVEYVRKLD